MTNEPHVHSTVTKTLWGRSGSHARILGPSGAPLAALRGLGSVAAENGAVKPLAERPLVDLCVAVNHFLRTSARKQSDQTSLCELLVRPVDMRRCCHSLPDSLHSRKLKGTHKLVPFALSQQNTYKLHESAPKPELAPTVGRACAVSDLPDPCQYHGT